MDVGLVLLQRAIVPDVHDDEEDEEEVVESKEPREKNDAFTPFTVQLDDPAGNSFIEFKNSMSDPKWSMRTYKRTHEQNVVLGLASEDDTLVSPKQEETEEDSEKPRDEPDDDGPETKNEEIYVFPGTCPSCAARLDTRLKKVNIPYFKVDVSGTSSIAF